MPVESSLLVRRYVLGNTDTFSSIQTLDGRQLVLIPLHKIGKLQQQSSPLVSGLFQPPSGLECFPGRLNGSIDIFLGGMCDVY